MLFMLKANIAKPANARTAKIFMVTSQRPPAQLSARSGLLSRLASYVRNPPENAGFGHR